MIRNEDSHLRQWRSSVGMLLLAFLVIAPGAVIAQPSEQPRRQQATLDEVVVTARRREESLQDTPVAISAFSAEALRERGITNTSDLTKSVPSLQIASGANDQIYIRGIGERSGQARVDPTVGVYLDDLFIPRIEGQLLDTVDVHSVQVLRGPQGTLFGKNTTGGAIVLSLAKPEPVLSGYLEGRVGNFGLYGGRAGINIPVSDRFYTRLALSTVEDDGFMKDIGTGDRNSSQGRRSAVFQTRWEPSDAITLDTLAFYNRVRERFPGFNCRIANEDALFIRGLFVMWSGDTDPSNPSAYRENCEANSRQRVGDLKTNIGETNRMMDSELDTVMLGATLNWQFSEFHALKVVLGFQDATRGPILQSDNDGGPKNFSEAYKGTESDRGYYSVEFQFNGSVLNGRVNYTAGLFGIREKNDESFDLLSGIAGLDATTLSAVAGGERPSQPPPGGTIPFVGILSGPKVESQFDLENTTLAAFAQVSWDITESLQLTLGLRQTSERRESRLVTIQADADAIAERITTSPLFGAPQSVGVFGPSAGGFHPYLGPLGWADDPVSIVAGLFRDETGDGVVNFPMDFDNPLVDRRKETFSEFTPMLSVSYSLSDHILHGTSFDTAMVYATWSNGFKSGFFEPRLTDGLQRVEAETVENRELGLKVDAFDRRLRFNAAVYSMVFDNMQLINVKTDSQGNLAVIFDNAGESRIEGGELELTWLPLAGLVANLSYSQNRYRFVQYEDLDLQSLAIEGREVVQDRTDEPFVVSPERTLAAGLQYSFDTRFGSFTSRVDASYKSEIFLGLDRGSFEAWEKNRRLAGQPGFTIFDVRFSWSNPAGDLAVATFVKNLGDKRFLEGTASVGDSIGTFNQGYGDPRRYGLEIRKTF